MSAPRRLLAALLPALLALGLVLATAVGGAAPAAAHSVLVSSNPAQGSTVTQAPTHVELVFNEDVDPSLARVVVADAAGTTRQLEPQVTGPTVRTPFPRDLAAGEATIRYRIVSADGHPVSGEVPFSYEGAPSPAPSTDGTASPAPTSDPAATGEAAPQEPADDNGPLVMAGLMGLGTLVFVGIVVLLVRSDRRRR